MNLGAVLKKLRIKRGFKNQTDAAEAIGTFQHYLSQLETGLEYPTKDMMNKISAAYKVPVPVIHFMALEEQDIQHGKLMAYRKIKPQIDALIEEII